MSLPFDSNKLRYFVPLGEISPSNFDELVKNITIETLESNQIVFKKGDEDNATYYLLNGVIEFTDIDNNTSTLSSKSKQCRFPLEHTRPRRKTAIAKTKIHYFKVNNDLLDILLTWDQNKNYIVDEVDDSHDSDWMTQLLQLEIFHNIPPANIQSIFQRMQSVAVKKDEVIIKQGDKGEYYYIIISGSCRILRNADETGNKELKIAELSKDDSFGEDALIANSPRNATVIMNTDGILMRLAKDDFISLLKEPILNTVNFSEAEKMIKEGAVWLDIRLSSEHQNKNISNSLNIPLYLLRLNANKLSKKVKYIIYCDTGSRSASATYILKEIGYDAYLLEGGLLNSSVGESAA